MLAPETIFFEKKKLYLQTTCFNRLHLNREEYVLLSLLGESVHSLLFWPKLLQSQQTRLAHSRAKCPKRLHLWHLRDWSCWNKLTWKRPNRKVAGRWWLIKMTENVWTPLRIFVRWWQLRYVFTTWHSEIPDTLYIRHKASSWFKV